MPKRKKLTPAVQPIAKGKQKQERMTSQERQDQIFEIIQSYMKENGYPPSVRDIGDMANLKSSSTVHGYITKLVEAGRIKRDEEIPRGITLADEPAWKKTVNVPLVGLSLQVPLSLLKKTLKKPSPSQRISLVLTMTHSC